MSGDEIEYVPAPVLGYTSVSETKLTLVNENKMEEEVLLRRIDFLREYDFIDKRWAAIAWTHFQEGFMALNRSIFNPERIALPGDSDEVPK